MLAVWRSGLTHCPLKATFTGSNPVTVTKMSKHQQLIVGFSFIYGDRYFDIITICFLENINQFYLHKTE